MGGRTELAYPTGVEPHGKRLRIWFMFLGKRYREPVAGTKVGDKKSILYAKRKRLVILLEIEENRFNYRAHFPNSKNADQFDGATSSSDPTIIEAIDKWLEIKKVKLATLTYRGYASKAKHVMHEWPAPVKLRSIKASDIERFQTKMLASGKNPKTVNDIFTVVRGIFGSAFRDGIIATDPTIRITNTERDFVSIADPFTRAELARLEEFSRTSKRPQDVDMILWNCWTGLSESELMAVAWEDCDIIQGDVAVCRARVEEEYKVTKEKSRARTVHLMQPAHQILKKQRTRTAMLSPRTIEVAQRDNITRKTEQVRFVWMNWTQSGPIPWNKKSWLRRFTEILRLTGIRHRGPNQCRHTYASQLISSYFDLEKIARQMGHVDTTMLKKHYSKFIPSDAKNPAAEMNKAMGFDDGGNAPDLPQKGKKPL